MNRFREELRIIPGLAWVVAAFFYLCLMILLSRAVVSPRHPELQQWNFLAKILFAKGLPVIAAIAPLLWGYIYADAKRRGMRYVVWTLLAIFVPNALGILLYFFFRDPLPLPCLACHANMRPGFAYCPSCGAAAASGCPTCKRPVERAWSNCPYCGTKLGAAPPPPPIAPPPAPVTP